MERVCFFILGLLLSFSSPGQTIDIQSSTFQDPDWNIKVKQLDDFIDRFNNQIKYIQNDEHLTYQLEEHDYRRLLHSLIELPDEKLANEFVEDIMSFNALEKISFLDTGWYAETKIRFTFSKESFSIPVILKIFQEDSISQSWRIVALGEPNESLWEFESNSEKFFNPANHNVRFSKFQLLFEGQKDVKNLFLESVSLDQRTIFLLLATLGTLDFEMLGALRYHFTQLPGYIFTVENFDRSGMKSGWLISNIRPANELAKIKFYSHLIRNGYAD